MTQDQRPRRYRPSIEGLEARDLPSSLQVVGPTPGERQAKGPYLNLIVVRDPSPGASSHHAYHVRATRGQVVPTPRWVNPSLLQELASTLYGPVTTTAPTQVGNRVYPPGTYA